MLESHNNIYILGIKGVAMSGIATILKKMGKNVTGSDTKDIYITDEILQKNNIQVLNGFKESNLPPNTDLVIYSASHNGRENPEVHAALRRSIKVISQAEFIGELMLKYNNSIAVCGCHGKTTTSSLLSYALIKLDAAPSYLVGTSSFNGFSGADFQQKDYFVVEADEYAVNPPMDKTIKLQFLNPDFVIATNIDFDHPDVYQNIDEVKSAFLDFFRKLSKKPAGIKRLFYCIDDENLKSVVNEFSQELTCSYGYSDTSDFQILNSVINQEGSIFELKNNLPAGGKNLGEFKINLYGKKNISNAAGVVALLYTRGFNLDKIKESLVGFTGAKRRLEKIYDKDNTYLYDDYAHHPEEIKTVIDSLRSRFPGAKINIIFQPHTYTRTDSLKEEFVEALGQGDNIFILPIFPSARENTRDFKISSFTLEEIAQKKQILSIKAYANTPDLIANLSEKVRSGDIILTMGAGDVYKLKDDIINVINSLC